ncbi:membrane metallo-endopeptidase-like 1 [Amblyomma americanum]
MSSIGARSRSTRGGRKSSKATDRPPDQDHTTTRSRHVASPSTTLQGPPTSDVPSPLPNEENDTDVLPQTVSNMAASPVALSEPEAVVGVPQVPDENAAAFQDPSKLNARSPTGQGVHRAPKTLPKRRSGEEVETLKGLQEMVRGGFHQGNAPCAVSYCCENLSLVGALGLKRDKSLEACEDFGQFVCSGWLHDDTRPSVSAPLFRLAYWLLGRAQLREDPRRPLTKRVRLMMDACLRLGGSTADTDDSKSLIEFMTKELFPWLLDRTDARLGDSDDYSMPLRALVNLSVLWATPLWFYVDVIEPWHGTGHRRSASMSPSGIPYITEIINREVNKHNDFYNTVVDWVLSGIFGERAALPAFVEFTKASQDIHRSMIGNLSLFFNATHQRPRFLLIRELPLLVPKLRARDWVAALQSAFHAKPPLNEEDTLIATNGNLLDAMRVLFSSYSAREVTFHTAWWFIQLLAPITSSSVRGLFMKHPLSEFFYPMACGINAANVYIVLFSGADDSVMPQDERLHISALLSTLHQTALTEVASWSILDRKVVHAVATRLQNASTVIWPPEEYTTSRSLEMLYGRDYEMEQSFFGHWRMSREQLQKALGSEVYQASLRLFRLQSAHLAAYNPATNVISVAVAALAPPYYAIEGTDAMAYGGLGFMYAMQLARTINALTVLLSDDMTQTPWNPASSAFDPGEGSTHNIGSPGRALWELGGCSANVTSGSNGTALFPLLPALKIAHAAYLHSRSEDRDLRLRGLEEYSAEQVFFLTACHLTCWERNDHLRVSPECTEAMRNFEPFAKAFSCPAGSPMNPKQKCVFL